VTSEPNAGAAHTGASSTTSRTTPTRRPSTLTVQSARPAAPSGPALRGVDRVEPHRRSRERRAGHPLAQRLRIPHVEGGRTRLGEVRRPAQAQHERGGHEPLLWAEAPCRADAANTLPISNSRTSPCMWARLCSARRRACRGAESRRCGSSAAKRVATRGCVASSPRTKGSGRASRARRRRAPPARGGWPTRAGGRAPCPA
jgi:hypothetical protein